MTDLANFRTSLMYRACHELNHQRWDGIEESQRPALRAALAELRDHSDGKLSQTQLELLVEAKLFRENDENGRRLTARDVVWNSVWVGNQAPELVSLQAWGKIPVDAYPEVSLAMCIDIDDTNGKLTPRGDACTGAAMRKLALRAFYAHCKKHLEKSPSMTLMSDSTVPFN